MDKIKETFISPKRSEGFPFSYFMSLSIRVNGALVSM